MSRPTSNKSLTRPHCWLSMRIRRRFQGGQYEVRRYRRSVRSAGSRALEVFRWLISLPLSITVSQDSKGLTSPLCLKTCQLVSEKVRVARTVEIRSCTAGMTDGSVKVESGYPPRVRDSQLVGLRRHERCLEGRFVMIRPSTRRSRLKSCIWARTAQPVAIYSDQETFLASDDRRGVFLSLLLLRTS